MKPEYRGFWPQRIAATVHEVDYNIVAESVAAMLPRSDLLNILQCRVYSGLSTSATAARLGCAPKRIRQKQNYIAALLHHPTRAEALRAFKRCVESNK